MASFSIKDLEDILLGQQDAFGRLVALNIQNQADLASHYPYSGERFRVFVDGSRQFIEYDGEPAQYEDTVDSHVLKPQADGEVIEFETTEIFRYAVQYVVEWSAALQTNQALQTGDVLAFGYGDADLNNPGSDTLGASADGYFWYWTPDLDLDQVTIAQYRNGTEQYATTVTRNNDLTDWTRLAAETNWYSIGESRFYETFTYQTEQRNNELGTTSNDQGKGPQQGNQPIQVAIKSGADSAGSLEVEVGSIGLRTLGDVEPILRRKSAKVPAPQNVGTANTFVPLMAVRIDPDRRIVNTQLTDIDVAEFSGSGDVKLVAYAFDPSKVLGGDGNPLGDANFSTPVEHSPKGSVIEFSTDVDQIPNASGVTASTVDNPGGYQEGYGSLFTSGTGSKAPTTQSGQTAKRPISERDVVVFCANATATGNLNYEYTTEQQW